MPAAGPNPAASAFQRSNKRVEAAGKKARVVLRCGDLIYSAVVPFDAGGSVPER